MISSKTAARCGPMTRLTVHKERWGAFEAVLEAFVLLGIHSISVATRGHTFIELIQVQSNFGRIGLQITRFNRTITLIDQIVEFPELALLVCALPCLGCFGRQQGDHRESPARRSESDRHTWRVVD